MRNILIPILCASALAMPVQAAAFPEQELEGMVLTSIQGGELLLGDRILQAGDVLTAGQAARMVFAEGPGQVGYLPILSGGLADQATLSLRGKEDQAPIAEDSALETYKNLPNTAKFKASDPENKALAFTVTRQPRRGTLEISDGGAFTYTPKKNKVGVDSFTYTATDPAGNVSREATVTITILKPTNAPQYTDTIGQDCRFAAEWMKHTGIFAGETVHEAPCFGPGKTVTRGEFLTMLLTALDIQKEEDLTAQVDAGVPQWLRPYVSAALRSGLTEALGPDQSFSDPVTCQEADALVTSALGRELDFDAAGSLTRADAAMLLYEAARVKAEQSALY